MKQSYSSHHSFFNPLHTFKVITGWGLIHTELKVDLGLCLYLFLVVVVDCEGWCGSSSMLDCMLFVQPCMPPLIPASLSLVKQLLSVLLLGQFDMTDSKDLVVKPLHFFLSHFNFRTCLFSDDIL